MTWLHDSTTDLLGKVEELKEAKAYPFFRPLENVGARVKVGTGSYVNFASNDYLGLSLDPRVMNAGIAGIRKYGTGLGSARPQATSVRHEELERRLAKLARVPGVHGLHHRLPVAGGDPGRLHGRRRDPDPGSPGHASIMDGMLLSRGEHPEMEVRFFKHNNLKSLRKCLQTSEYNKKMIVVEGYYSVDGDMAPIPEMVALCREFDAVIVVDDAHGLGALGATGRGVAEVFGVQGQIDLLVGTFSKSFGGIGGFVCGDQELIDFMKLKARAFMFSASLPVSQVDAALKALDIIESEPQHLKRLHDNGDVLPGRARRSRL